MHLYATNVLATNYSFIFGGLVNNVRKAQISIKQNGFTPNSVCVLWTFNFSVVISIIIVCVCCSPLENVNTATQRNVKMWYSYLGICRWWLGLFVIQMFQWMNNSIVNASNKENPNKVNKLTSFFQLNTSATYVSTSTNIISHRKHFYVTNTHI